MTATAGFGNSFFIGLFGDHIRHALAISHGEFGLLYMAASVLCGLSIPVAGKYIDHMALSVNAALACLMLAAGGILLSLSGSMAVLLAALFMIRLGGPGMVSHIAVTSMGYYFSGYRGRAVGISLLGQPLSEAVLPAFAVASIALIGWRETWIAAAGTVLLVCLPAAIWLSRDLPIKSGGRSPLDNDHSDLPSDRSWTRHQVLRGLAILCCDSGANLEHRDDFGPVLSSSSYRRRQELVLGLGGELFHRFCPRQGGGDHDVRPLIDRYGSLKNPAIVSAAYGIRNVVFGDTRGSGHGFAVFHRGRVNGRYRLYPSRNDLGGTLWYRQSWCCAIRSTVHNLFSQRRGTGRHRPSA